MLQNLLRSTDLTDKEGRLYLAALQTGKSTITAIARRARVNRITAYSIADKLVERGYFTVTKRGQTTYFDAINPEFIYETQVDRNKKLKSMLPDLRRLHSKADHPNVRYFEGIDGIKAIYLDSLNSTTEILNYANSGEIRTFWPEYDEEYVAERARRQVFLRGFAPDDEFGQQVFADNKLYHRQIKLLPANKAIFHNETNIYDDKIAMVSLKDKPMGIIIQSQDLADTQRSIFELLWELG